MTKLPVRLAGAAALAELFSHHWHLRQNLGEAL